MVKQSKSFFAGVAAFSALFGGMPTAQALYITPTGYPFIYLNADKTSLNFLGADRTINGNLVEKSRQHYDSSLNNRLAYFFDDIDPALSLPTFGKCGPPNAAGLAFDGSRTFGEFPIPTWNTTLIGGNYEMTVSAWVYVTDTSVGLKSIASRHKNIRYIQTWKGEQPSPYNYSFFLGVENRMENGVLRTYPRFSVATISGVANIPLPSAVPTSAIPRNQWVHLAGVFFHDSGNDVTRPGKVRLYTNGNLIYEVPRNDYLYYSYQPVIIGATALEPGSPPGASPVKFGEFFRGVIDEFKIYERGLNQSQVRSLMSCGMQQF